MPMVADRALSSASVFARNLYPSSHLLYFICYTANSFDVGYHSYIPMNFTFGTLSLSLSLSLSLAYSPPASPLSSSLLHSNENIKQHSDEQINMKHLQL